MTQPPDARLINVTIPATIWTTGTKSWSTLFPSAYPLNAMTIENVWIVTNARAISAEIRKNGIREHLSTKNVARPNAGVKRLRQKKTAWAPPWPKPPARAICILSVRNKRGFETLSAKASNISSNLLYTFQKRIRSPSWKAMDVIIRIAYGHHAVVFKGRKALHTPDRTIRLMSHNSVLERTVRIKKGFLEMTETKREKEGPRAIKA